MPGKKPNAKELDEYRNRLKTVVAILSGDIGNLEEEALGASDTSKEGLRDGGSDGYNQEFSLQLLERDESTMRELLAALDRVENGSYGRCESCEEWIKKDRLRMVPHARLCIECKRKEEEVA